METRNDPMLELLVGTMDAPTDSRALADAACYSVAHTYRLFRRTGSGTPMATRRRLLLERAAYELTRTRRSATEIAFDSGYGSLEGFSRAFRTAYGVAPSQYRKLAPTDYRLTGSALHFVPAPSSLDRRQGAMTMNLLDLILDDHRRVMHRNLDLCERLPAETWDTVLPGTNPFPWMADDETLRDLMGRCCGFGEPWIHMLDDQPGTTHDGTVPSFRAQLDENHRRFRELVRRIESEGSWDLTFVDHECEPPEVFSYGSVVRMNLVYTSHARVTLEQHLNRLNVEVPFG